MQLQRGDAEHSAHATEQAKRLWGARRDATLAEQIGRENASMLDRGALVSRLLARDDECAELAAECAQLRHDMSLMTEALRQVVEAQETAAVYGQTVTGGDGSARLSPAKTPRDSCAASDKGQQSFDDVIVDASEHLPAGTHWRCSSHTSTFLYGLKQKPSAQLEPRVSVNE